MSEVVSKGGWKTPPNPEYHPCEVPPMTYRDAARVWECPECGADWTLLRNHGPNTSAGRLDLGHVRVPGVRAFGHAVPKEEVTISLVDPNAERYTPTDLRAPGVSVGDLPPSNITPLDIHSQSCAHRNGTGMCSCNARKTI